MKNYIFFVIAIINLSNAFAGVFGPSNYDECVLDKMKGQSPNMREFAHNACEINFPKEKLLDTNMWSAYVGNSDYANISYEYKKTTNQLIDVIVKNESNYKITKIVVRTKNACNEKAKYIEGIEVSAPLVGNTFTAKVNDTQKVQCIEVDFFGKRYK